MTPRLRRWLTATAFLAAVLLQSVVRVPPTQALSALVDPSFDIGAGPNQVVLAVAFQAPDKIIIAGDFTRIGDADHFRVARLNANGSLDATFTAAANGNVNALAVQADGKVLIGGSFSSVNGTARRAVARLNADGTLDGSFQSVSFDSSGSVATILVAPDQTILIGGYFTTVNNVSRVCLARLAADGTVDPTFNPPSINGTVATMARDAQGRIVIGGHFSTVGGQARAYLARLSSTGVLDATFRPNPGNSQAAIGLQGDASVIAQRGWTTVNGQTVAPLGRFRSADGALDSSFFQAAGVAGGSQPAVYAMDVQPDDRILLGGNFATVNGVPSPGIARLNSDGTVDSTFIVGTGVSGGTSITSGVYAIARQPDQRVVIGGDFTVVDGVTCNKVARLMTREPAFRPDLAIRSSHEAIPLGNNVYNLTGADQMKRQLVAPAGRAVYIVSLENDGDVTDSFKISGMTGSAAWSIRYFDSPTGGTEITSQVTGAGWTTGVLAPRAGRELRIEITPAATLSEGRSIAVRVIAGSIGAPARQDAAVAIAIVSRRGNTLMSDRGSHRVIEVDPNGAIVWQYGTGTAGSGANQLNEPFRVNRLASGNTLMADYLNHRIIEVAPNKTIVWQFDRSNIGGSQPNGWGYPHQAERLPNGNTLIAATGDESGIAGPYTGAEEIYHRLIEVRADKTIIWQYDRPAGTTYPYTNFPFYARRLPNGNTLFTEWFREDVIEVTYAKAVVWTYGTPNVAGAGANQLSFPQTAERLRNGNTLISEAYNSRVIEVTPARDIVWQYGTTGVIGRGFNQLTGAVAASRLANGNTLIADSGNYRVIEVDRNKNVIWSYGNGNRGSGPNELTTIADVQRIGPQ